MKKLVSIILTLVLCVGLAAPAYAWFPETVEDAETQFGLEVEVDNNPDTDIDITVHEPFYTLAWDADIGSYYVQEQGFYNVVGEGSTFTATNLNPDNDSYMTVRFVEYYYDDAFNAYDQGMGYYLFSNGEEYKWVRVDSYWDQEPDMLEVNLYSGESITFELPLYDGDACMVQIYQFYPDMEYYYWMSWDMKRDDAKLAELIANAAKPEADPVPESGTVYARTQTILVDDKQVTLQAYAIKDENGNETNYVKIRDLADVLNGSAAQFNVGWDGAVNLISETAYAPTGQEHNTPYTGDMPFKKATFETKIDGVAADLKAFVITDSTGGGNTYYKLRDIGEALGFDISWSAEKGIYIETDKPYTAD